MLYLSKVLNLESKMQSYQKRSLNLVICCITILLFACSRDSFEPTMLDCDSTVTYDGNIKAILDSSCSYSGCHDGSGIGPLNYNSYQGMLPHLQSGSFESRVINQKDDPTIGMPPDIGTYPQSIKSDLTEEELLMVSCWLENGFPEN